MVVDSLIPVCLLLYLGRVWPFLSSWLCVCMHAGVCPDSRLPRFVLFGLGRGCLAVWIWILCLFVCFLISYITFRVAGGYREDGGARLGSFCQTGDAGGRAGRRGRRLGRAVCWAAGLCQRPHAALSYRLVLEPASRRETKQQHRLSEIPATTATEGTANARPRARLRTALPQPGAKPSGPSGPARTPSLSALRSPRTAVGS